MFMFCEDPRIINLEIDLVVLFNPKALLAQEACVHNACLRAPCVAWPLLLPSFSLFFLLSLCFPKYFGIS